jgi:MoaA/NifB/PqqE/SkfB family radical SAM enzyme
MNVQIDSNCNLKCGSCRNEVIWSKPANPTAEKILNRLIEEYQDFNEPVWFQCDGTGDIFASTAYLNFFNSDRLPKCFQFNLTTNGNLVTKNLDVLEKIKDQIFSVCVSFDAATPETYKDIRGGKFDLIVAGVKAMKNMGIYRVNTSFVTQKKNYLELLDHYNMCKELGINYSGLSKMDRWLHMSDTWWEENRLDNNPTIDYDFLIHALKTIKQDPKFGLCGGLENLIATKSI